MPIDIFVEKIVLSLVFCGFGIYCLHLTRGNNGMWQTILRLAIIWFS